VSRKLSALEFAVWDAAFPGPANPAHSEWFYPILRDAYRRLDDLFHITQLEIWSARPRSQGD
jgi:hypothetical protein